MRLHRVLLILTSLSLVVVAVAYAEGPPAGSPVAAADEQRPTERVSPAPEVNGSAVVWRTPEPPRSPEAGDVWVNPKDGMEMVYVPAGEFIMGSPEGDSDADEDERYLDPHAMWVDENENPQRRVYLGAFWVDKTEVTVGQYRRFCRATGNEMPDARFGSSRNEHPIVEINWHSAVAYAQWAGKRLPTEAEWEKAARGTDGREYPWGNEWDVSARRRCNFADRRLRDRLPWRDKAADDGFQRTAPVGSYPEGASPYGCLDMAGNVDEWCADWYGEDYYQSAPMRNPGGPSSGEQKVVRSGSWFGPVVWVRCANRTSHDPANSMHTGGFRCARDAQ